MKRVFLSTMIGMGLTLTSAVPGLAETYPRRTDDVKHKKHVKTAKRVGVGAAGGAAVGALAGGGKGAGIGAAAGAGAGAIYDKHKKHQGKY